VTAALVVLAWVAAAFALLPLGVGLANLRDGRAGFRRPGEDAVPPPGTAVSILVPARDEAGVVERTVRAALASRGVVVEVVVLDDGSTDATPEIVRGIARRDARVRLVEGRPLPSGWAGKQHACSQLAEAASHEVLVFVDADIVLVPDAAARAAALLLLEPDLGLVSGFPRQRAETLGERLVVPWIHLLLLGYLPMAAMRQSRSVAFGAGCGQWMVARRDAYRAAGGHGADPLSRHDGLALPRAFRRAGWRTDLFDGSTLAACRMYDGFAAVWRGFGKSAGEGMATPRGLPVWTLLLGLGHVVPWVLLAVAAGTASSALAVPAALGVVAGLAFHVAVARRVGGSPGGAVLHPLGALLVLAIQWAALLRHLRGRPSRWKGRAYAPIGSAGAAADPRIGA
jgi:hypothetical protein